MLRRITLHLDDGHGRGQVRAERGNSEAGVFGGRGGGDRGCPVNRMSPVSLRNHKKGPIVPRLTKSERKSIRDELPDEIRDRLRAIRRRSRFPKSVKDRKLPFK